MLNMDTLFTAFLIQLIICVLFFALVLYFVFRNGELRKRVESLKEKPGSYGDKD